MTRSDGFWSAGSGPVPGRTAYRRLGTLGRVGVGILAAAACVAVLAPLIAPYAAAERVGLPFERPGADHWLGTDDIGQDIFSELIYGARISLFFGVVGGLVATLLGLAVGLSSGFLGGRFDAFAMRGVDLVLVMPFLPLLLVLAAFLGGGVGTEIAVISAVMWAPVAREIRAQTLSLRERGYVQAALAFGAGPAYVLRRYLAPGVAPLIPPQFIRAAKSAILLEASLSFLGLGDPTVRSWGTMLYYANARSAFMTDAWLWWVLPPGLCIGLFVLGFAFAGLAIEERARPTLVAGAAGMVRGSRRRFTAGRPTARGAEWAGRAADGVVAATPAPDDPMLRIRGLTVSYGPAGSTAAAVRGVDLDVDSGEVVGVVGESGSGKTTLAHAVLGLVPPPGRVDAGSIRFSGEELLHRADERLRALRGRAMTLVPQSGLNALNPVVRVQEQIVEALITKRRFCRSDAEDHAARLLDAVGIDPLHGAAYPHQLSGGMKQRVLVAMALAPEPRLVLADEPTTGLDTVVKLEVVELLREAAGAAGAGMLLISHDVPAVLKIADRLVVMRAGEIVEHGTTAEVVANPHHPYTERMLAGAPPAAAPRRPAAVATSGPVLRVQGVSKRYLSRGGSVQALDQLSLEMAAGEIVGVVGRSGAGKSTLARVIFGLEEADAGVVEVPGVGEIDGREDAVRDEGGEGPASGSPESSALRRRQLVMQDPYSTLPPHLDVGEIVTEPLRIYGERPEAAAAAARASLETVGLQPASRFLDRYPQELSGGERQRVALARALAPEPEVVVADEPASMLDAPLRAEVAAHLARCRSERGAAILYITHDIGLAAAICDRLLVIVDGRVVESGVTADLLRAPRHPASRAFVQAWRSFSPAS